MKKLLFMLPALMLASCGGATIDRNATRGVVDCHSIRVVNGGSTVFSGDYYCGIVSVYEYKNAKGEFLYTPNHVYNDVISVYQNRYNNDHQDYSYTRLVGYLALEYNYLLDLDERVIDSEIKYSEYHNSKNLSSDQPIDNKEAYKKAKKCFYPNSYEYIILDEVERGMEFHSYTKLGEDCVITYKTKQH